MLKLLALNALGKTDVWFFIACAAIVVIAVVVYFLVPVFNKKQYREQRENLKKREAAFKANKGEDSVLSQEAYEQPQSVSEATADATETDK